MTCTKPSTPPADKVVTLMSCVTACYTMSCIAEQLFSLRDRFVYRVLVSGVCGFLGLAVADATSGIAHWFLDHHAQQHWPLIGRIAAEFQEHHDKPDGLYEKTFWSNCVTVAQFIWPAVLLAAVCRAHHGVLSFGLFYLIFGWLGQGSHRWAHARSPHDVPWIAHVLRRLHLALPAAHHRQHHRAPFQTHFCIVNGMNNPWMDAVGFFALLDCVVLRVFGMKRQESESVRHS